MYCFGNLLFIFKVSFEVLKVMLDSGKKLKCALQGFKHLC